MKKPLFLLCACLLSGCTHTSELTHKLTGYDVASKNALSNRSLRDDATLYLASDSILTPLFFDIRGDSLTYWSVSDRPEGLEKRVLALTSIDAISFKTTKSYVWHGMLVGFLAGTSGWFLSNRRKATDDLGVEVAALFNTVLEMPLWLGGGIAAGALIGVAIRTERVDRFVFEPSGPEN